MGNISPNMYILGEGGMWCRCGEVWYSMAKNIWDAISIVLTMAETFTSYYYYQ